MNKIIILGHPCSGYGLVESLLMDCGMRQALPSRREGLLPKDIHRILREAHNLPETHTIMEERGFHPVEIGPVWHGMALDLLLGNLGQEPWGWADPQTLFFSDYWQSLDPESVFILVYDSPASVLHEANIDPEAEDKDAMIRSRLDNWAAYNSAILSFFFQHMDRCVLVHSRQSHRDLGYCIDEIKAKMNARLPATGNAQQLVMKGAPLDAESGLDSAITIPETQLTTAALIQENPTSRFFIDCQLNQHPRYIELYQELQAAASIPLQQDESAMSFGTEAWFAWLLERRANAEAMDHLRKSCGQLQSDLHGLKQEHQAAWLRYSATRDELEQTQSEYQRLADDAKIQAREWMNTLEDSKRLAESNWKMLCAEREDKEKSACEQATMLLLLQNRQKELEASQGEKLHLQLKLEQTQSEYQKLADNAKMQAREWMNALEDSKRLAESNLKMLCAVREDKEKSDCEQDAMLLLLHNIQEELESCHIAKLDLRQKLEQQALTHRNDINALLLRIEQLETEASVLVQVAAQSVQRVKRQLSYRIGSTIVSRSKSLSGWLGMPWAISRVLVAFYKDRP